jgi:hypothetical protein
MAKKTVLAIGIDPAFVDFSALPGYSPDLLRSYIDSQIERLCSLGYDAGSCLIDLGDTAEAVVAKALRSKRLDCAVPAPGCASRPSGCICSRPCSTSSTRWRRTPAICFNTNPADTAEAVQRWVEP